MKPIELLKIIKKDGWSIDRIHDSYYIMKHSSRPDRLVIPMHKKDLKPGTYNSILKQAGLKQQFLYQQVDDMNKLFYPAVL